MAYNTRREGVMFYRDLKDADDMSEILSSIKSNFGNLARLTLPEEYEPIQNGNLVLTVFQNLEPVMRIEGVEMLLDLFREVFEEEKAEYIKRL